VKEIVPTLERAFAVAQEGVPGPVFVECPIDILYDEELVRSWYGAKNKEPGMFGKGWFVGTSRIM